jgi:uncharacterized protein (DUF305 family)
MKNNIFFIAALAVILISGLFYVISKNGQFAERFQVAAITDTSLGRGMMGGFGLRGMEGMEMRTHMGTGVGMGMMGSMMISSEREFLTHMIPHHEEAVTTAREVLARGATTPQIASLMERIITTQQQEIRDMKAWYETWYGVPYTPTGTYQPMMPDLTTVRGIELDRVFLSNMIAHHMGAIMMSRSVQPYITHTEMQTLTLAIVDSQSKEIAEMRQMLGSL